MNLRPLYPLVCGVVIATVTGCDDDDVVGGLISDVTLSEEEIEVNESIENVESVSFKGGKTLTLDVGVGSGAFHFSEDSADEFFTITDRGPTISCAESAAVLGVTDFCMNNGAVDSTGQIFAVPSFTPTIYKFNIDTGGIAGTKVGYEVIQTIKLLDLDDQPISGMPNLSTITTTENGYDNQGNLQGFDPEGVDPEALVRLPNQSFWVAEEYSPSLIYVNAKGRILGRFVPNGVENDLANANYRVTGSLPAILAKRQTNRGIESLAVSPDGQFLYFMMESPLANPDSAAFESSRYVRLFKISLQSGGELDSVVGEYVYELDKPDTFTGDNTSQQSDVKVSEMVALGTDKLVILERVTRHTKLYRILISADTTNILGTEWDTEATSQSLSLETLPDLAAQGITPLSKTKVFDSLSEKADLMSNVEGMAVLNSDYVALINDNDFGVEGIKTSITILNIAEQLNK